MGVVFIFINRDTTNTKDVVLGFIVHNITRMICSTKCYKLVVSFCVE